MKKINTMFYKAVIIIAMFITSSAISAQQSQVAPKNNNSPYSLAQIKQHLKTAYREDIKRKDTLRRWDLDVLTYDISTSNKVLNETEKQIFVNKFKKYGKIIGIKTKRKKRGIANIQMIFTDNFLRTIQHSKLRNMFFGAITQASVNRIIAGLKRANLTSYGVQWSFKSPKVNRTYILSEVSEELRKYLEKRADYAVFDVFAMRWSSRQSNIIKPSILNNTESKNIQLQPIDRYYLEVLYSDKVHYGMEMSKAIDIMANYIYKKLGE